MDKLKEEIITVLQRAETIDTEAPYRCLPLGHLDWAKQKADKILAIFNNAPSGLVAKKGCLNFVCRGNMSDKECVDCNGTGFISHPLTVKEALELNKKMLRYLTYCVNNPVHATVSVDAISTESGERVEVEDV